MELLVGTERKGITAQQVGALIGEMHRFMHKLDTEISQCEEYSVADPEVIQLKAELTGMKTAVNVIADLLVQMEGDPQIYAQMNLSVPA